MFYGSTKEWLTLTDGLWEMIFCCYFSSSPLIDQEFLVSTINFRSMWEFYSEADEIKAEVWLICPLKSPCPDGKPMPFFYRRCWEFVGTQMVLCFELLLLSGDFRQGNKFQPYGACRKEVSSLELLAIGFLSSGMNVYVAN